MTNTFQQLTTELQADDAMAWAWQCNLAVPFMDEGGSHQAANKAAARIMQTFFDIDVTQFPEYQAFEKIWETNPVFIRFNEDNNVWAVLKTE